MNLKQKLSKKLKKTGGFTLIEMLIVVAIIAILVAVSIPMVNSNLEKAREATDAANARAAKGAAMIEYLMETPAAKTVYHYKSDGTVSTDGSIAAGSPGYDYGQSKDNKKGYVKVTITPGADGVDDTVLVEWETPTTP